MKNFSFLLVLLGISALLSSCSTTQDIVVTPHFISNSNLPQKPIFYTDQNNDYFHEKDLLNSLTANPTSDTTTSMPISPFVSFHTTSSALNELNNWHNPYSMRVRLSGYYGNQYYSSYAHGFYWGILSPGATDWCFPLPSATFLSYQFTSSMSYTDRIRYQTMRKNQYCRVTQDQTTNTYVTYHLKKANTYSYNTKKRTQSQQGYYHYTTNTAQQMDDHPRVSGGSRNSGGGNNSGNVRTRITSSNAPVRTYTPRTSGRGSSGSGNAGSQRRQRTPTPTSVPRKF